MMETLTVSRNSCPQEGEPPPDPVEWSETTSKEGSTTYAEGLSQPTMSQ